MTIAKIFPIHLSNKDDMLKLLGTFTKAVAQVSGQPEDPPISISVPASSVLVSGATNAIIRTQAGRSNNILGLKVNIDPSQKKDLEQEVSLYNKALLGSHEHLHLVFEN